MPIFEFHCQHCDIEFEELVFSRSSPISCPRCGGDEVRKRPSTFAAAGTEKKVGSSAACSGCASRNCASCGA